MTAMRTFSAALGLLLALSFTLHAQTVHESTVTMSDGITLDALFCRPSSAAPAGGYPAVLLVHGFGGSKNNVRSLAQSFSRIGYVTVGYSVRGQGASGGQFDFFTSDRILADLRGMIDYTAGLEQVNAERIAVMGGSQGGLHAWMAAAFDMPVRTVVSIIANARFRENWLENNALNWIFSNAALTSGVRFDPATLNLLQQAQQSGRYDAVRDFLTQYSTNALETEVEIPVAVIVSAHDIFFNQNAAIRQFANVPTPSRFILYPGEHDLPSDPEQNTYVLDVIDRWLRYWLKDEVAYADVASPDSAVVHFDGATGERRVFSRDDEGLWLTPDLSHPDIDELTLYFSNRGLMRDKPLNSGQSPVTYAPLLGSQAAVFRTEPMTQDLVLAPFSGIVSLYSSASGTSYQMNVSLFDLDPLGRRTPIGRGHMQVDANTGTRQLLQFELTRVLHTVRAGHVIEAQLHGGVPLIPDFSTHFGNIVFPPRVLSENVLSWGGDAASMLRLYTLGAGVTSTAILSTPSDMYLGVNYPNPFNASTFLPLQLAAARHVRVRVFSSAGREVAVLHDGMLDAGRHALLFEAGGLPSGIYFCRVESEALMLQRQIVLLR
jgi:predicted acyl esterase